MNDLAKAAEIIKNGGIVIFPTDTAYGIGCRVDSETAVKRLFELRKRPNTQATPVLFDGIKRVTDYVLSISPQINNLMQEFWPGALTIVLRARVEKIPSLVRGGTATLGVRVPNNSLVQQLINLANIPILGPSANFHGMETPFSFEDLDKDLVKVVDFVLQGEVKLKKASTVVDCSVNPWKILRQGAVDLNI